MKNWNDPQNGDPFDAFIREYETGKFKNVDNCPLCGCECEGVCEKCADEYGIEEKE